MEASVKAGRVNRIMTTAYFKNNALLPDSLKQILRTNAKICMLLPLFRIDLALKYIKVEASLQTKHTQSPVKQTIGLPLKASLFLYLVYHETAA